MHKKKEKEDRHEGYQIRLVPGGNKCDHDLTDAILKILQDDFKLKGANKKFIHTSHRVIKN